MMKRAMGRLILWTLRWREEGPKPAHNQYVLIAAPHTSNWDMPIMMALSFVYGMRIQWMGKHTLFKGPLGLFMRACGGIAVERSARGHIVQEMTERFANEPNLVLIVPTEGTRARVKFWKSGFYHIARTAQVPVVMGYLDYKRRRGGFGPSFIPTGDASKDMDKIRQFYATKVGRFPQKFSEPRLKEEAPLMRERHH